MKKLFKVLGTFLVMFGFTFTVNAANANFSVTSSANQVIIGKSITVYVTISSSSPLGSYEYTLNYDHNVFKCTDAGVGLNYAGVVNNNSTYSITYKYAFVAQNSGTGNFYIDSSNAFDFNEKLMSPINGSKNVKAITYAEYTASLSKNNNLKKLEVEGYEIEPEFNKDKLEYSVQVKEDEEKVKIIATPEDRKATVSGDGEVEVSSGSNSFDIVVIAENGSEKTYKLNVEVIDKDPINVEVDGKKYTVVKVKSNLTTPTGFTETTVKIKDFDIPAFNSEVVRLTLVGLKDEEGNISLFVYDNDKYTKYIELNFGNLVIYPLSMNETLKGYSKASLNIKDNKIECLETSKNSRFKLIYGRNIETNETGLYLYDTKDDNAVRFDDAAYKMFSEKQNLYFYLIVGFAGTTLITLIILIAVASKKGDKPKKEKPVKEVKEEPKEEKKEIPEVKEETDEDEFYDIFENPKKKKKH